MLYIRMFVAMIVGLYTSRVVLNTLGVEDYGIYAIVGGFISMMSFLNASMSGATSRFITFELGKGNMLRLKDTFSSAMLVHIGIALIILIAGETIGLWFFMNKLVIPEARIDSAMWMYQMALASTMMTIATVPYNASIIAHEKMDAYAYIEIMNVILKLAIVYMLTIGDFDKLKMYACLLFLVSVIVFFTYHIYCRKKFEDCRFRFVWNPSILKPMLKFSGLDLYGYGCTTLKQQGTNIVINMFFGVVLNAASGIASTISGMVSGFARNITTAFRPQIIKNYSTGNTDLMKRQIYTAMKYTLLLYSCFCIPLYIEIEYVMKLWLVNVPEQAPAFCSLMLICCSLEVITGISNTGIHATGNIKYLSLFSGSARLVYLFVIYILFKLHFEAISAYYLDIFLAFIIFNGNSYILKIQVPDIKMREIYSHLIPPLLVIVPVSIITGMIAYNIPESFLRLCIITVMYIGLTAIFTYLFIMDKEIKHQLKATIKSRWQNRKFQ